MKPARHYGTRCRAALALLACVLASPAAAEPAWVAALGATSDYVHRGLTQSSGQPAVQASVGVNWPAGTSLAVWASTIDTRELEPDTGSGDGVEIDVIAGYTAPVGTRWQVAGEIGHYTYQGTGRGLDYDYTEASVALAWRNRLRLAVSATDEATDHTRDNALLRGPRTTVELAGEWPVANQLSVAGGLGYADASAVSDVHYLYGSTGVNWRSGSYLGTVSVIGTDDRARQRFTDGRADTRLVVSLTRYFSGPLRRGR